MHNKKNLQERDTAFLLTVTYSLTSRSFSASPNKGKKVAKENMANWLKFQHPVKP